MASNDRSPLADAPMVLEANDRFYRIISSGDISYELHPLGVSVIAFFVIRRANGRFDIYCIHKFWEKGEVRRTVQVKRGIPEAKIEAEIVLIRQAFGGGIERETGCRIKWRELDLSNVEDKEEQVRLMNAWPGMKAWRSGA
jgi:hypothetical protein